jgi:hypothetical protein
MSASQISPAWGIVKPFVLCRVTIQESVMISENLRPPCGVISTTAASASHPRRQLLEVLGWKVFDCSLQFLDFAHALNISRESHSDKALFAHRISRVAQSAAQPKKPISYQLPQNRIRGQNGY